MEYLYSIVRNTLGLENPLRSFLNIQRTKIKQHELISVCAAFAFGFLAVNVLEKARFYFFNTKEKKEEILDEQQEQELETQSEIDSLETRILLTKAENLDLKVKLELRQRP